MQSHPSRLETSQGECFCSHIGFGLSHTDTQSTSTRNSGRHHTQVHTKEGLGQSAVKRDASDISARHSAKGGRFAVQDGEVDADVRDRRNRPAACY